MSVFESWLPASSVARTLLVVSATAAFGVAMGRPRWRGVGLGVVGVLFAGLAFARAGLAPPAATLDFLRDLGLILFVYSIGVQVGPGFGASLRNHGAMLNVAAAAVVVLGTALAVVVHRSFGAPLGVAVGILAGATTNTPSLAAAQHLLGDLGGHAVAANGGAAGLPGVGYAVAYPLGVVGVIASMLLLRRGLRVDVAREAASLEKAHRRAANANLTIRSSDVIGRPVSMVTAFQHVTLTRRLRDDALDLVTEDTILALGDVVHVVGEPGHLERLRAEVGDAAEIDLRKFPSQVKSRWLMVTATGVIGKTLKELDLRREANVLVTRLLRAGVELPGVAEIGLHFGDMVLVVGEGGALDRVARQIGDTEISDERPSMLGLFSGLALGVVVGTIPLPVPGVPVPIKLGLAGGPLLVAMALSRVGRVGPVVWYLPPGARVMLRDVGIVLFLACVGLKSGHGFFEALASASGWVWMGLGGLVTLIPLLTVGLALRLACRVNFIAICGFLAGSMTDPPALAFAGGLAGSEGPAASYAAVYPLVMVLRVVSAQLLVLMFA
jgi:putative transport protein